MSNKEGKKLYPKLVQYVVSSYEYYELNNTDRMTDSEYDALCKELLNEYEYLKDLILWVYFGCTKEMLEGGTGYNLNMGNIREFIDGVKKEKK